MAREDRGAAAPATRSPTALIASNAAKGARETRAAFLIEQPMK